MLKHNTLIFGLGAALAAATLYAAERPSKGPPASASSSSQEPPKEAGKESPKDTAKDSPKEKAKEPEEKLSETKHTVTIGGVGISYTAKAGTILLRDEEDKPTASIFYIAYTRDEVKDLSARPITFSFNGGPGSSSVWMHLGMLGPRRVHLADDGGAVPPPYHLVDNEFSLLDETDLVFIDPVSTGYSRAIPPKDAKKFHGLREDASSVAEFIRLYVTRNKRWVSPKFIIGESYGTTRAAALSGELSQRLKMNVNGIMLVSTVLNFQTLDFSAANDLPYILYLPTYAATAWFHKKLPADLQEKTLSEVFETARTFAAGEYSRALQTGSSLAGDDRRKIIEQYARLTGLSTDYVERANLRISLGRFASELLASENRVIGRYDSRYKGYVRDRLSNRMEQDPSYEAVTSVFASTFNDYVRNELKYETDLQYEILASVGPWNWDQSNGYVDVGETLASAMTRNPFLKVHVSSGFYDLATPFFATLYTVAHLNLDPTLLSNFTLDSYTAGHMMYLNQPDLKKSKSDLARFISSTLPTK
ncbi:MAG TPA: peptidase S10 [Verrucomicrobiae bacterium]